MPTTEQRELIALRTAARAQRAISLLEMHRKTAAAEYSERIKRLRSIVSEIQIEEQKGTLALEGLDAVTLSQDDEILIHDPLRGL